MTEECSHILYRPLHKSIGQYSHGARWYRRRASSSLPASIRSEARKHERDLRTEVENAFDEQLFATELRADRLSFIPRTTTQTRNIGDRAICVLPHTCRTPTARRNQDGQVLRSQLQYGYPVVYRASDTLQHSLGRREACRVGASDRTMRQAIDTQRQGVREAFRAAFRSENVDEAVQGPRFSRR